MPCKHRGVQDEVSFGSDSKKSDFRVLVVPRQLIPSAQCNVGGCYKILASGLRDSEIAGILAQHIIEMMTSLQDDLDVLVETKIWIHTFNPDFFDYWQKVANFCSLPFKNWSSSGAKHGHSHLAKLVFRAVLSVLGLDLLPNLCQILLRLVHKNVMHE